MLFPHVRRAISPHLRLVRTFQAFERAHLVGVHRCMASFVHRTLLVIFKVITAAAQRTPCDCEFQGNAKKNIRRIQQFFPIPQARSRNIEPTLLQTAHSTSSSTLSMRSVSAIQLQCCVCLCQCLQRRPLMCLAAALQCPWEGLPVYHPHHSVAVSGLLFPFLETLCHPMECNREPFPKRNGESREN